MRLTVAFLVWMTQQSFGFFSSFAAGEEIKCKGWGGDQELVVIPESWVNDGYCDCIDGLDEPNTEACAGAMIGGWPGVKATSDKG